MGGPAARQRTGDEEEEKMRIARVLFAAALAVVVSLTAARADWLDAAREAGPGEFGLNKTTGGALVGAALGGLLGAQLGGRGDGRLATTAIGVLAGAWLGSKVGTSLDQADRVAIDRSTERALDTGRPTVWRNPDRDVRAEVMPRRAFRAAGTTCRDFERRVTIAGETERGLATACRLPSGDWQVRG
jgi:surface antigen